MIPDKENVYLVFGCLFFLLIGCKENHKTEEPFEKENIIKVGKELNKRLKSRDTLGLKSLLKEKIDSQNYYTGNKYDSIEASNFFMITYSHNELKENPYDLMDFLNKKVKYIKTDTLKITWEEHNMKMPDLNKYVKINGGSKKFVFNFYKYKGNVHSIYSSYSKNDSGKYQLSIPYKANVSKRCENETHRKLKLKHRINCTNAYIESERNIIQNPKIKVSNRTNKDITFIKFRLTLIRILENGDKKPILKKNFERNVNIPEKNMIRVSIPDLDNTKLTFYPTKENLKFDVKILGVRPNIQDKWCKLINHFDIKN